MRDLKKRFIASCISLIQAISMLIPTQFILPAAAAAELQPPVDVMTASVDSIEIENYISEEESIAPDAPSCLLINELVNPLNVEKPTFGWVVNDKNKNEIQTAYEIVVTDEISGNTVWDSGKVNSSEQSYVSYGGDNILEDGHPYSWKVKTWDKDDMESPFSDEAYFATGISNDSWNASWISDGTAGASASMGKYNHFWYVRGSVMLESGKTVKKALGYFSAAHDYDLYVNGTEIGRGQNFDYASEMRYQGWDITDAVNSENLTVGALVRTYGPGQGRAALNAGFIGRVIVYYTDGTSTVFTTNATDWKISKSVPYSGTSTRNGEGDFIEKYNAQNVQEDFSTSDFDSSEWITATLVGVHPMSEGSDNFTNLIPELSKMSDDIVYPVSVETLSDGTTVADFGKVIPARPVITFKNGTAGNTYTIQGGYVLNDDGTINTAATATQGTTMTWQYTQKDGEQTYRAWDHLGFRYISIPSCGETFSAETIRAELFHTDVPEGMDSTFESSNDTLNKVYELMKRSAIYSIQNSFVDTPTREKGQFLQDAINISEASMSTYYERAATKKAIGQFVKSADRYWTDEDGNLTGQINSVYPNGDGQRDIPDFTVNFPYWIYNYYMTTGDTELVKDVYVYVKAVADYISECIDSETGLVTKLKGGDGSPTSYQYGIVDWPASGRFGYDWSGTKEGARTTVNMLSKRAYDVTALLAEIAGETDDIGDMQSRSQNLKTAINEKLLTSDGIYCDGLKSDGTQSSVKSQHSTSYALAFDIAPEDMQETMAKYVADKGMNQGPMTADILVKGLFNAGENAAALKLFTEPKDNGWARTLAEGGTFTWEEWSQNVSNSSMSHGWGATAVSDILENFAGVSNMTAGAASVRIAPVYCELESLEASVSTERGKIGVSYKRSDSNFDISITIPANVTAQIELPVIGDGEFKLSNGTMIGEIKDGVQLISVGSGTYMFEYDGEITVLPEEVEYEIEYNCSEIFDFTELDSDVYTASYEGDFEYNDYLTLSFKSGSTSISKDGNGFDLYNDGSYIKFTAPYDGKITVTGKRRVQSGSATDSTLYKTTDSALAEGENVLDSFSAADKTAVTIASDIKVEEGVTYYFYNTGGRPLSVASIEFEYESSSDTVPSPSPDVIPTDTPEFADKIEAENMLLENGYVTETNEMATNGTNIKTVTANSTASAKYT